MKQIFIGLFAFLTLSSFASEEMWMRYSSISPDGQSIAFSYQGDLFVVPVSGGDAKQITSHSAYDFMPVWSHDSKKIAFASNRYGNFDVYLVEKDGGVPDRLTFHSANDYPYDFKPDDQSVVYLSNRLDIPESMQFPRAGFGELYSVSVNGGREMQELSVCAEFFDFSKDGKFMIFQDVKGYEDEWRKHHQSSVTRDIVLYDFEKKNYRKLTNWNGEDRNPVFIDQNNFYFLSEKSGTMNIWKGAVNGDAYQQQVTDFKTHPVRFLSMADNGTLCFGYHGEIFTWVNGTAKKVDITVRKDETNNDDRIIPVGETSEFELSPDGKEVVFVFRGDVFASSVEFGTTRQITATPEQERNVSFSPDGKKIIYAGERNKSWNIYEVEHVKSEEKHFHNATLLKENVVVETADETFDPKYSPNGEEVAFLKNRTTICVINLKSKEIRTVLPGDYNYSYTDGDQYYTWSPDSRFLLVQFFDNGRWKADVGLVNATGKEKPVNLTQSGYGTAIPKFSMDGQMIYYVTDRYGMRSHASWGSQRDVEAIFLTRDAYYRFTLSEEDYKAWKEAEDEAKKAKDKAEEEKSKGKKKEEKKEETVIKEIKVDWEGIADRKVRLTVHSSDLADVVLNKDATEMYYVSSFEKDGDIWVTKFKTDETKILLKGIGWSNIILDKEEKLLFYSNNGMMSRIEIANPAPKPITVKGEMRLNEQAEREYMFEHAWRQVREKFYVEDLHGVDWEFMKKEYQPKLATINNGYDFSEMLSELLGELNASHTGASYRNSMEGGDGTASLGCYFDNSYTGEGLRIAEIMDNSPLLLHSLKIKEGVIIERIDGQDIKKNENYYPLLNRKAGKKVLLSCYNPDTQEHWDEIVIPINNWEESKLAYERWMKRCEHLVDSLSGGKIAYVHIESMGDESFRKLFDKALGKYNQKEALIIDTRFNGGGWLHDDLATFLSGKLYMQFEPRGQNNMGGEPIWKWQKASCVLMSEGNYSDAHLFPYTYKALEIGPLIGMPVPGTGTAVWWERMIDGATVFGIPQVGMRSVKEGYLVENHELQPDVMVENDYEKYLLGIDQQLEKAVQEMLKLKQ